MEKFKSLPSATSAFAPLILPILLIALKSVANFPSLPFGKGELKVAIDFVGEPTVSLLFGVVLCLFLVPKLNEDWKQSENGAINRWAREQMARESRPWHAFARSTLAT